MSEFLAQLLRMNLAAAAAIAVVMALRLPARRLFGARLAYRLWSLAPLAALALLLPARVVTVQAPVAAAPSMIAPPTAVVAQVPPGLDLWGAAVAVWIAGGLASLAWLAWRQHQFGRALRDGRAGPAVVGVLRPRIVTPDDFAGLYTPREQLVVLAHERTHLARNDARVNALVALARCVNWFNPLVHLMAHYLRIDQELACDAQVIAAHPAARRAYAEAMLKTQLAARPLPLGCYWPAEGAHPLADRIRLLARSDPSRRRRLAGTAAVALLSVGAMGSAWAAKPAQVVAVAAAPSASARPAPNPSAMPARAAAAPAPAARPASVEVALEKAPPPPPEPPPPAASDAQAPPADSAAPAAMPRDEPARTSAAWSRSAAERTRASAGDRAASIRPLIAPGTAVRIQATTTAPDGATLANDITSYGSNPLYRSGSYRRYGSAYGLYTSVYQNGDRFWVTATLMSQRQPLVSGSTVLRSSETGEIALASGQVVTVTATSRPETPEETEAGQTASRSIIRAADAGMAAYRERARPPRDD